MTSHPLSAGARDEPKEIVTPEKIWRWKVEGWLERVGSHSLFYMTLEPFLPSLLHHTFKQRSAAIIVSWTISPRAVSQENSLLNHLPAVSDSDTSMGVASSNILLKNSSFTRSRAARRPLLHSSYKHELWCPTWPCLALPLPALWPRCRMLNLWVSGFLHSWSGSQ